MPDSKMTDRKMLMEIYDMTKKIHDHLFEPPPATIPDTPPAPVEPK